MRFGRARLATGPTLHYAEHGDAEGEPVVFLHGWPDSWYSFSMVVAKMPRQFRALVPDQRGFGDSDRPAEGYGIDEFGADAVAFLDALAIDRASFVGHSLGTFIARRIAITRPDRIDRMVLIGAGVSAVSPVTREVQTALSDLPDPVPEQFARDFQASTAYASVPKPFFERIVTESLKLPSRLWREIFEGLMAYDDRGQLASIAAPTLVLWGEHDALFSRADQDDLAAAIAGARLRVYREIGHCPNWECPEQVAMDIREFLLTDPSDPRSPAVHGR